jgi:hypothetical protein
MVNSFFLNKCSRKKYLKMVALYPKTVSIVTFASKKALFISLSYLLAGKIIVLTINGSCTK